MTRVGAGSGPKLIAYNRRACSAGSFLTAICLLREHLTRENHAELLAEAAYKTKRQIQELIARRFPTPDAESRIRKLPERQARVANTGMASGLASAASPIHSQITA